MRIYDVSLGITDQIPVWPGDPQPNMERITKIEDGAECNVSQIAMSVHIGTHVDAPYHYLGGEALTVELIPLQMLIGRAYVLQMADEIDLITATVLDKAEIPPRTRRLLFKTRNSQIWHQENPGFQEDFVAISSDGAQYLVDRGIRLVGVDYLSVAPFASLAETHRILLQAGVIVIEGMDLSGVTPGRYALYCLPLKIVGADGAPARVILIGV
jgi:arylformamidase